MPFWKNSLIKHLGLNCIRYVNDTKKVWGNLVIPSGSCTLGSYSSKTFKLTNGWSLPHSLQEWTNRWAVSHRASSPDISLPLLLTSINKKQLLLRSWDEERSLTINQLISRTEPVVIPLRAPQTRGETFPQGFSGNPHTAWEALTSGTLVLH